MARGRAKVTALAQSHNLKPALLMYAALAQTEGGGDLHARVDPGRTGIDDGDPGQHVLLEDPAATLGLDRGQLGSVVDPHRHREVVGEVGGDRVARLAQGREDIGQVVLALGVVVGEAG